MSRILVIGATSAIAHATSRIYAARGAQLVLVGRSAQKLAASADDLRVLGAARVEVLQADANDFAAQAQWVDKAFDILQRIDVVLVAHGTLSNQAQCQQSVPALIEEFNTNALSAMAMLTLIANRMEQQGHGAIAVISSVAGDRGRPSNYVYGSAKAALTTFLGGLRARLFKSGVHVVTIKPGFVDTPMTAAIKKGGPLWAKPDAIAAGIVHSIEKRRNVVYLPWFWRYIMLIIQHVPEFIFKRLSL
jgi:decaprenylphospho-beta-D-erythro-pentofuranosid-2-ulose 2-reductase